VSVALKCTFLDEKLTKIISVKSFGNFGFSASGK
jgi:hypothetical protein